MSPTASPPRKRGRPSNGQAQSNAERQRAWRQRQAEQRERQARDDHASSCLTEFLRQERDQAQAALVEAQRRLEALEAQVRQLQQRPDDRDAALPWYQDHGLEAVFVLESRLREERTWKRVASMGAFTRRDVAEQWLQTMQAHSSMIDYRVTRLRFCGD